MAKTLDMEINLLRLKETKELINDYLHEKQRAERAEAALRVAVKALSEALYSLVPLDYSDMEAAIEQARAALLPTTQTEAQV